MSVWASMPAPDDDPGGSAPIVYQGSHVLPTLEDPRGGCVDLALIPGHVRWWRDNPDAPVESEPELAPEPFLRFGTSETLVLTRRQVLLVHETLGWWLRETQLCAACAGEGEIEETECEACGGRGRT